MAAEVTLKLTLVRHAQAESNLNQLMGRNNHVALTDKGIIFYYFI